MCGKRYSNVFMRKVIYIAVLVYLVTAAQVYAIPFTVDAYLNSSSGGTGLNTGISLTAGDLFTVTVDPLDLWNAGALPRWSNADGLDNDPLYATGSDESGQPAGTLIGGTSFGYWTQNGLTARYGSLVGEITGTYFLLGTNFSSSAPSSGNLKLYYWDANFHDNTEHIIADVNVINPVPEPSTLLLLGSGLIGLAGLRKKVKS